MKNDFLYLIVAVTILSSCKLDKYDKPYNIGEEVQYIGKVQTIADTLLMEKGSVLRLEDNDKSLFIGIDRILKNGNRYYLLDKRMKQILIYDTLGHYLSKIYKVGNGIGEYVSLKDIAIDKFNGHLLLLADPSMILYYNLNGQYIKQMNLKGYHNSIGVDNKYVYLSQSSYVNNKPTDGSVIIIDKETAQITEKMQPLFETAPYCYSQGMSVSATDNHFFTRKFDDNIYSLKGTYIETRYSIYWNDLSFPENMKEQVFKCTDLTDLCLKNNYVYSITDINETDDDLSFRTNLPGLFILNKKNKEVKWYAYIESSLFNVPLPNYLPIGGTQGEILFIFPSHYLMMLKKRFDSKHVSSNLKKLLDNIDDESNPILLKYKIK